ncbi:SCO6880 family protein [Arthrobacter antibioticus]|uniref:SCO6880 family protein n=1 Tax=Arthrobacter sp. H35-MC1 TaxID=3046203 RepID=UPI0024BA9A61|nr:SCO6880 family protein [Arthrobacter sp. H35-MC1]MDJ0318396.1 type VII secretion protein EccE [Arthrobacter sp. H35-MC1]
MSENTRTLQPVKFPRYERHGLFMGFQWYQLGLVAIGVLAGTIASATGGPPALILTMPIWLGLILFGVLQYQRIPYPVWASAATIFLLRQQLGQTKFLAKPEQPRPAGHLALPGGLGSLELRQTQEGAAFVVDRQGHEAIAVLRCTTTSFALLDDDDKAYAVQAWSRVQTAMAQRPAVARLAIQDYTVPYPSTALREFYDRAKAPTRIEDVRWGDKSYLDLIAAAGSTMIHELFVCLVIDTAKARRRIRDAGGSLVGMEHVVASEVEALTTGLKSHGVTVDEWLPGTKLTAVMRGAFDPEAVTRLAALEQGTEAAPLTAGPMAVEEHWSYLRTDSGFHQTFWIAEWPRQQVFPGFLHPVVYVGNFRHTVTEVIRAIPSDQALRDIRSAHEAHDTRRRINARFDRPLTREQRAEEEEVAEREDEIVAGHGDVRPAAYITITADTLDDLARYRQELESAAAGAFVELRLLAGQQWPAFVAGALPLGRGLK